MKKWIPITALTAVLLILCLVTSVFLGFKENNEVFTRDFFKGVKSAHITFYQDPIDTIEGLPLLRLCQDLSALELEPSKPILPPLSSSLSDDMLYGCPYVLVFTYHNGDTVSIQFHNDRLMLMELNDEELWAFGPSYSVAPGDVTAAGMILAYFDRDSES